MGRRPRGQILGHLSGNLSGLVDLVSASMLGEASAKPLFLIYNRRIRRELLLNRIDSACFGEARSGQDDRLEAFLRSLERCAKATLALPPRTQSDQGDATDPF
jgi:hypothetical protein